MNDNTSHTDIKTDVSTEADNVDKIRDILFGNQIRDFDNKFSKLEKRINTELANIRKENAAQIESIQTYVDSEIKLLAGKLVTEAKTRLEESTGLNRKVSGVAEALDLQTSDLNQKILKQTQGFNAEINNQLDQTRKRLEDYKQELSQGKVDKTTMSEVLNSLALQINANDR